MTGSFFCGQVELALFASCFYVGFFLGLFFDPEDGGDCFTRKFCFLSKVHIALYPRKVLFNLFSVFSVCSSCSPVAEIMTNILLFQSNLTSLALKKYFSKHISDYRHQERYIFSLKFFRILKMT
jgi:hypothetical protein